MLDTAGNLEEFISDVLPWIPSHGPTSVSLPTRTYQQQFCTDTGYSLEDLLEALDDRDEWWEIDRERGGRITKIHDDDDDDDICTTPFFRKWQITDFMR